jgi:hypothetical protein
MTAEKPGVTLPQTVSLMTRRRNPDSRSSRMLHINLRQIVAFEPMKG